MHKNNCNCENPSHSSGGFLAGVVLGGVIGAGMALFLTPYDGKKNRKIAREKGEEILHIAEDQFEEFKKSKLDPMMKDVQKDLEKKFDTAKKDIEKKIKDVNKKVKK